MDITGILFLGFIVWGLWHEKKQELANRKGASRITR